MNEFNEWLLKEHGIHISSSSGPWRLAQNAWEFQAEKIKELEEKLKISETVRHEFASKIVDLRKKLADARETLSGICYCDDDPAYRSVEPCRACECLKRLEEK